MLHWLVSLWRRLFGEKPVVQSYHRSNLHGRR
jgi:hypothetical protein